MLKLRLLHYFLLFLFLVIERVGFVMLPLDLLTRERKTMAPF